MPALTASRPQSRSASPAIVAMYVGLALTVLAAAVVFFDQSIGGMLDAHTRAAYSGTHAGELGTVNDAVRTYLYVTGAIGVACWLWMIWAVRQHRRWARASATTIFVCAAGLALVNLLAEEYGNTILPTTLGVVGVLPCLAGLVAVVLLWKPDRSTGE